MGKHLLFAGLVALTLWGGHAVAADLPRLSTSDEAPITEREFQKLLLAVSPGAKVSMGPQADAFVPRAEALARLVQAVGLSGEPSHLFFKDVTESHPRFKEVTLAGQTHLITGYPDNTFRPDEPLITREAIAMTRVLAAWREALPNGPNWAKRPAESVWTKMLGGIRLLLTIGCSLVASIFLFRAWRRKSANRVRRTVTNALFVTTLLLTLLWVAELFFNLGTIGRNLYQLAALVSLFAGLSLVKAGHQLAQAPKTPRQRPQPRTELGYIDHVSKETGELYLIDPISRRRTLAIVSPGTRYYDRQSGRIEQGYFSQLKAGDLVNAQGVAGGGPGVMTADSVMLIASQESDRAQYENMSSVLLEARRPQVYAGYR